MRLKLQSLTYRVRRVGEMTNALGVSLAAGFMAFLAGVVVPVSLWERFARNRQTAPSADAPVIFFSLIFSVILALVTIAVCLRWLIKSDTDREP